MRINKQIISRPLQALEYKGFMNHEIQVEYVSSHSMTSEDVFDGDSKLPAFYSSHEQNVSEGSVLFNEKMECHLIDETLSSPMLKRQQVVLFFPPVFKLLFKLSRELYILMLYL